MQLQPNPNYSAFPFSVRYLTRLEINIWRQNGYSLFKSILSEFKHAWEKSESTSLHNKHMQSKLNWVSPTSQADKW